MSQKALVVGMSVILAIIFIWLGLSQAAYLERGYSISLSLGDRPPTVYHEPFPYWLKVGHALTGFGVITSLVLGAMLRPAAVVVAWAAFASATVVGCYDVFEYGTIATPTSLKFYVLILGIGGLMTYLGRMRVFRA